MSYTPHGEGVLYLATGEMFIGNMVRGVRENFGQLLTADGDIIYQGHWSNNVFHGKGTLYLHYYDHDELPGSYYNGTFENGLKVAKYPNAVQYDAQSGTEKKCDWLMNE